MMRRTVVLVALAGCPTSSSNPDTLWLAPDQAETRVKLADTEPGPY